MANSSRPRGSGARLHAALRRGGQQAASSVSSQRPFPSSPGGVQSHHPPGSPGGDTKPPDPAASAPGAPTASSRPRHLPSFSPSLTSAADPLPPPPPYPRRDSTASRARSPPAPTRLTPRGPRWAPTFPIARPPGRGRRPAAPSRRPAHPPRRRPWPAAGAWPPAGRPRCSRWLRGGGSHGCSLACGPGRGCPLLTLHWGAALLRLLVRPWARSSLPGSGRGRGGGKNPRPREAEGGSGLRADLWPPGEGSTPTGGVSLGLRVPRSRWTRATRPAHLTCSCSAGRRGGRRLERRSGGSPGGGHTCEMSH